MIARSVFRLASTTRSTIVTGKAGYNKVLVNYISSSKYVRNGENNEKVEEPVKDNTTEEPATDAASEQEKMINTLQAEIKTLKDTVIRSYAEEENVRRIAKRDVDNAKAYANTSFAKALLEVSDNLDRALDSAPKAVGTDAEKLQMLIEGVTMTQSDMMKTFKKYGVVKFGAIGEKFDPNLHDALFSMPLPAEPEGKEGGQIAQVLKVGFMLKDRVIRAAEVGTYTNP